MLFRAGDPAAWRSAHPADRAHAPPAIADQGPLAEVRDDIADQDGGKR
jgi:hypothetical protein